MQLDEKAVVLGMSGGVDSSTAAAVLMRAGYTVIGCTCIFVHNAATKTAIDDARAVAQKLGIRHVVHDASASFSTCVVDDFVESYASGFTPIPCVTCNHVCKIPALIQVADQYGCAKVATGHYARMAQHLDTGRFVVKTALDTSKDQSYMLSLLTQDQLARLMTPLGGTTKTAVRLDAADLQLPVADKPESQDICFIDGDYRAFLKQHGVNDCPGAIVDVCGNVLGTHTGLSDYTVGQRKGIGVAAPEPYYVIAKRAETNELVVGSKQQALIDGVRVADMNWQAIEALQQPLECNVKLRYRSTPAPCTVSPDVEGGVRVHLHGPQATTAPGQIAVFSIGDTVLGGGTIVDIHSER